MSEVLPALVNIVMILLAFSIANGMAIEFTIYVAVKLFAGKRSDIILRAWF